MTHTIASIATELGLHAEGALDLRVTHAAEPADATADALAMAMSPKYAEGLSKGQARAAVLWPGADWRAMGLQAAIFAPRPRWAMAGLSRVLDRGYDFGSGIHPSAIIDPTAQVGDGASIGPFVVIGARTRIGTAARIAPHVTIAEDVVIGADATIHAGARVTARVRIGERVILHPNAVIGGDGFSFVTPEPSGVEEVRASLSDTRSARAQKWERINSLGAVTIGDDVEIGSSCSIDRGTVRDTVIGSGTKLDSLVHLGHNVQVGQDCLLCAMVGIAGSSRIGNRVVLAGKVAVNDNISVGDDVLAGGGTRIFTNVPAGRAIFGDPATKLDTQIEIRKAIRRLPRLAAKIDQLQKAVFGTVEKD